MVLVEGWKMVYATVPGCLVGYLRRNSCLFLSFLRVLVVWGGCGVGVAVDGVGNVVRGF